MKICVSLPGEDVRFLDEYAREQGYASRSAALQHAVRLLRASELGDDYAAAFAEWSGSDEAAAWDAAVGDALSRD